jgi:hypothetical protein
VVVIAREGRRAGGQMSNNIQNVPFGGGPGLQPNGGLPNINDQKMGPAGNGGYGRAGAYGEAFFVPYSNGNVRPGQGAGVVGMQGTAMGGMRGAGQRVPGENAMGGPGYREVHLDADGDGGYMGSDPYGPGGGVGGPSSSSAYGRGAGAGASSSSNVPPPHMLDPNMGMGGYQGMD